MRRLSWVSIDLSSRFTAGIAVLSMALALVPLFSAPAKASENPNDVVGQLLPGCSGFTFTVTPDPAPPYVLFHVDWDATANTCKFQGHYPDEVFVEWWADGAWHQSNQDIAGGNAEVYVYSMEHDFSPPPPPDCTFDCNRALHEQGSSWPNFTAAYVAGAPVRLLLSWNLSQNPSDWAHAYSNTSPLDPVNKNENPGGHNPSEKSSCSQSCAGDPVNTATGNYSEHATDFVVPGRGPGLDLERDYNAVNADVDGPFGHGWSFTYGASLAVDGVTGDVDVAQEDGSHITFNANQDGTFTPASGRIMATLTRNADGTYTLVRNRQLRLTFSAAGQLLAETDLNGYQTTLTYDSNAQLSVVTDATGRTLTFGWNNGHIVTVDASDGRELQFTYGGGDLLTATDPTGATTTYGYDSAYELTTLLDPNQLNSPNPNPVTNVYDGSGRVTQQSDPNGGVTSFDYTSIPGATEVTDSAGRVTLDRYDNGVLSQKTLGYGTVNAATWQYQFDPTTLQPITVTDPLGHAWSYTYNNFGDQLTATDALGHTETRTFNSFGEVLTDQDRNGVTTTNTYDSAGNLLTSSTPDVQTSQTATTTYTYGDANHPGDVTAVTNARNKTTTLTYDGGGELGSSTDPDGNETTYSYTCAPSGPGCRSNVGWVYSSVSPRGNATGADPAQFTTSYTRDDDGRALTSVDARGKTTTVSYDADGNATGVQDPNGNLTQYTYNKDNQLTVTTRADTTTLRTGYDDDGNLTSQTDAANHTTSYGYDALNQLTSVTDPLNRTTAYGYDAAGRLNTLTDPASRVTSYGYDAANRLTSITYSDGATPTVTYGYDDDGNRTAMSDGSGSSSYVYDSLGRMTSATDGAGHVVGYGYDLDGDLTSLAYPNGNSVSRVFDDADQLTSVTDWNNKTTSFGYDPDGDLTSTTSPNGVVESTTLNNADQVIGITDNLNSSTLASYSYGRDNNGQLSSTTPTGSTGQGNETYGYSPLNQLTTDNTATDGAYSTDPADNLTGLPSGATQAFDVANQLTSVTAGGQTTSYGYDSRGNRTSMTAPIDVTSYGYDQANRLTNATTPSTSKTYQYDGDGLQVASTPPKAVWAPPVDVDAARAVKGVSCPSASFCAAVDGSGFAQTFNGSGWSTATDIDGTNALAAVSCPSSSFCAAVDGKGHAQIYNGSSWSAAATVDSTRALKAVSCPSANFCAAVDGTGYALTYNGSSWSTPTNIDGTKAINGVSCPSSTFCVAVDGSGNVLTYNGTSWSAASNKDSTRVLKSVSCSSSSFCMAVDGSGYALTYNGTSWSAGSNVDSTRSLNAVSCVNASYCQAVDGSGNALTYNGSSWSTAQDIDAARVLNGVSCPTATFCAGADGSGYAAFYRAPVTIVQLTWDVSSGLPLLLNDGTNNYVYGPGGLAIEQLDGAGTPTYLQHDQQLSTRVLTDATGNVVGTYTYDPYGRTVSHTGTATSRLQFNGQYEDAETGLYYLRARYYDPQTGQFLTRDPLEETTRSPYGYIDGEPLDGSDPTGLDHCIPFTNICVGFHPGTIPNSIVNLGRGFSFGLSDRIANKISPGSSCTVPQNSAQQLVGNAATIVGLMRFGAGPDEDPSGSTGRNAPQNLKEQLALQQAQSDPGAGLRLPVNMGDPRWPASDGWVKMSQNVNGVEIHYVYNSETGATADWKFK